MASIKLGQLMSLANRFSGNALSNQQAKAAASNLLKQSPLEIPDAKAPTSHMKANTLSFAPIQFPSDLGNDEQGHFMIFYSISNKHSALSDKKNMSKLGIGVSGGFDFDTGESSYSIAQLKSSRDGDTIQIGKQPKNSINAKKPTHTQVTGAVALYMPPGIKAEYSVENGPTATGLGGLAVRTFAETTSASGTEAQTQAFLKGVGGFALSAAKDLGVGLAEAAGLGDVSGAISKVTGFAQNPFTEVVFEKVNNRDFSYTFNLQARSQKEVQDINKIITFFKYHMHPEMENDVSGGRYFKVPSEFEIHYAYNGQVNNYLNKLSRCVLTSTNVSYGEGDFTTFRQFDPDGAAPVNIKMTLAFTETEIMTKERIMEGY
jgi:hypothetical protein